jgi:indole-3-glycerol phosphate synthase
MASNTFLERMLAHKREEVERQKAKLPLVKLEQEAGAAPPVRPFAAALRHRERLGLIAEIKKQSPAKGQLAAADFDPVRLARIYAENGADAISVLTDARFFGGSLQHLKAVRGDQQSRGYDVPLLRKDFLIDEYQVTEARAYGADAILIIVAAVEPATVGRFLQRARQLGMDALVEVHTAPELQVALEAGADLLGINNRNLHTFEVDVYTTDRIMASLPTERRPVVASLSGLRGRQGLDHLRGVGADAILVGEAIMTAPDPAAKVRELSGR